MGVLRVGTSGYNYYHWRGKFYPEGLPSRNWLEHYASVFNTVELNVTFYRLPRPTTFARWYSCTPREFTFALKGNRAVTHTRRLRDAAAPVASFFERARELKEKLSVVLWQLPPSLKADLALLQEFCALLREVPGELAPRHAFEFRHPSWFCPEVYALLEKNNFALCIADAPRWPTARLATADFVYIRFHGSEKLYASSYTRQQLEDWAAQISRWLAEGRDVYAYFNNDAEGHAVANARELCTLLGLSSSRPNSRSD